MPKNAHAFLGWTKAISDKSFFIFRASLPGGSRTKKNDLSPKKVTSEATPLSILFSKIQRILFLFNRSFPLPQSQAWRNNSITRYVVTRFRARPNILLFEKIKNSPASLEKYRELSPSS